MSAYEPSEGNYDKLDNCDQVTRFTVQFKLNQPASAKLMLVEQTCPASPAPETCLTDKLDRNPCDL